MQPVIVEKIFNAPIKKVWAAITDKEEMKQWYFDLAEFKAEKGFTFTFTGGPSPEKQYMHVCEVTEVAPPNKLAYTWRYEGYEGVSTVTFELFEQGDKTLLRLTHEGLETFPSTNPDFASSNFVAGWNDIITKSLSAYLEPAE
jgi:uncharacterized protein YndB with AHSA1/START domain